MSIPTLFTGDYARQGKELEELTKIHFIVPYLSPFSEGLNEAKQRAARTTNLYMMGYESYGLLQSWHNYWHDSEKAQIRVLNNNIQQIESTHKVKFAEVMTELKHFPQTSILFNDIVKHYDLKEGFLDLFHRLLTRLNPALFIDFIGSIDLNHIPRIFMAIFMRKIDEFLKPDLEIRSFHKPEKAIEVAARIKNLVVLKKILQISPSWISPYECGKTLVLDDDTESLQLLKEAGLDLHKEDDRKSEFNSLFEFAGLNGKIQSGLFLDTPELPKRIRHSGLCQAVFAKHYDFFEAITEKSGVVELRQLTWLQKAVNEKDKETLEYLVAQGFILSDEIAWVYRASLNSKQHKIVSFLISKGCDPNKAENNIPPMEAPFNNDDIETITVLLEGGYNLNEVYEGKTWLYRACEQGKIKIVHEFLRMGANPNKPNDDGKTPEQFSKENLFETFTFEFYKNSRLL